MRRITFASSVGKSAQHKPRDIARQAPTVNFGIMNLVKEGSDL